MLYADVIEVEERVVPHRKEYVHEPKKDNVAIKTLPNGQQVGQDSIDFIQFRKDDLLNNVN